MVPYVYHTSVVKTTIYLPEELKSAVAAQARREGRSEAEVIREAIAAVVKPARPKPVGGLYSAEPIADRADDLLQGFGER